MSKSYIDTCGLIVERKEEPGEWEDETMINVICKECGEPYIWPAVMIDEYPHPVCPMCGSEEYEPYGNIVKWKNDNNERS